MKYVGKLYGKIGDSYFDTGHNTDDWDELIKKSSSSNCIHIYKKKHTSSNFKKCEKCGNLKNTNR